MCKIVFKSLSLALVLTLIIIIMKKITLLAAFFAAFAMNAQVTVFEDDFNSEVVDSNTFTNWVANDVDGDGENWEVFDADATGNLWDLTGLGADSDSWEGTPFNPDQFLTTAVPLPLTGATGSSLTFTVGTYQTNGTFLDDRFSVYLTTSNDPAVIVTETPVLTGVVGDFMAADQADGSASSAILTEDISAFDGQAVYLTFRHHDTFDQNSVLIDDVLVEAATFSVSDNNFTNFIHTVNSNELEMRAAQPMESISLFNVLGQQVVSQKLSSANETVNIGALNAGVYIANVTIEGQTKSFKIVKR